MPAPHFPIHKQEPLLAFASRLACSRGRTLEQFCSETGITVKLPRTWPKALQYLSEMTGVPVETLREHGASRVSGTTANKLVPRTLRWTASPRFCPTCLVADMKNGFGKHQQRPWMRELWHLVSVAVCERHFVPLEQLPNYGSYQRDDYSNAVFAQWQKIDAMAECAKRVIFEGVDQYFSDRFHNVPTSVPVLDNLSYGAAFSLVELVGAMDLFDEAPGLSKISGEDLRQCRIRGFNILSEQLHFKQFLNARNENFRKFDDRVHWSRIYGALHRVVLRNIKDPAYADLAKTLRRHAMAHHPIGPQDRFLGFGGDRHWHSVESLSVERDVDPDLLRSSLFDVGVLGPEHHGSINHLATFKVAKIEQVPAALMDGVTSDFAMASLGITLTRLRQLNECGLLSKRPARDRDEEDRYSRKEILDLGSRAYERAVMMDPTNELVSISAVTFETSQSYVEVLRNILDGSLRTVGFFGTSENSGDLGRLLVDLDEVKRLNSVSVPIAA